MSYDLDFTEQARDDIASFRRSGSKSVLKKLFTLLNEIAEQPYTGTGKPELLKHQLSGCWSRRINREHRLVYEVLDDKVVIHSAKGHY
ncbi:MAG: Txe/YoeB family addiction module toxin [Tunicatimonas sp.]